MKDLTVYATPRIVKDLDDCLFYHSMDLPNHGFVSGVWDLRSGIEKYLGKVAFRDKRVLDVGTSSGFLAFWMESQGAEVVGFDVSDKYSLDIVPYEGRVDSEEIAEVTERIRKVNNSFWFAHTLHGSKVKMVYGTVYKIPDAIGLFDVAIFGAILLHLRDPFLALQKTLRLTTQTVVIVEPFSIFKVPLSIISAIKPIAAFRPEAHKKETRIGWWALPPRTIVTCIRFFSYQYFLSLSAL